MKEVLANITVPTAVETYSERLKKTVEDDTVFLQHVHIHTRQKIPNPMKRYKNALLKGIPEALSRKRKNEQQQDKVLP